MARVLRRRQQAGAQGVPSPSRSPGPRGYKGIWRETRRALFVRACVFPCSTDDLAIDRADTELWSEEVESTAVRVQPSAGPSPVLSGELLKLSGYRHLSPWGSIVSDENTIRGKGLAPCLALNHSR